MLVSWCGCCGVAVQHQGIADASVMRSVSGWAVMARRRSNSNAETVEHSLHQVLLDSGSLRSAVWPVTC
jgi:deoxyxylulose-5-phosphate synthase